MKTIAVLFFVMIGLLSLNINTAVAGPLSDEENKTIVLWLSDPEARPAIEATYWNDVEAQLNEMRKTLPEVISPVLTLIGVDLNKKDRIATYRYMLADKDYDLSGMRNRMVKYFCQDEEVAYYMTIMGGAMHYIYYIDPQLARKYAAFGIRSSSCSGV
jgi:hypothetical protein